MIPKQYDWLLKETAPKMLVEAVRLYGLTEVAGGKHNPVILGWAAENGLGNIYTNDEIPWCGLFILHLVKASGKTLPFSAKDGLWALNWAKFGTSVKQPMLGDILTFKRPGGGHVGMYIGEDSVAYHVIGGNQGDCVKVIRIGKDRLHSATRPPYNEQPASVRKIMLAATGSLSQNEQ